jgi:hypothetical protein
MMAVNGPGHASKQVVIAIGTVNVEARGNEKLGTGVTQAGTTPDLRSSQSNRWKKSQTRKPEHSNVKNETKAWA